MLLHIKEHRVNAGISVPQMSKLTGIPIRTIEELEKRGDCAVSRAKKIADTLGITLNDLLEPPSTSEEN